VEERELEAWKGGARMKEYCGEGRRARFMVWCCFSSASDCVVGHMYEICWDKILLSIIDRLIFGLSSDI
jgi:hypothetical protein